MQHKHLQFGQGFRVVLGDSRSQAAQMTLAPGQTEGVRMTATRARTSGSTSSAEPARRVWRASTSSCARGEAHEIRNTGDEPLKTLNVYVPPAYTDDGDELPAGRAK
jgi:mannose-6-phosphate isomerase-like protein (cupin superfamily)